MNLKSIKKALWPLAVGATLALGGCSSTGSGYTGGGVGPSTNSYGKALGSTEKTYTYNKDVYLDVAIPVIDPGFPMKNGYIDEKELVDENIWPEIRRLESKRFSVNIREALVKTKSFGSVRVVPGTGSSADLYIIGRINESNTMDTNIGITVVDSTNKEWGEKTFKMEASSGFYRDSSNEGKDPNYRIYSQIADWIYNLVQKKNAEDLKNIQLVSDMRYAEMYSPQEFNRYLTQNRGVIKLNGIPADADSMLARVREFQAQDEAFVDSLQSNYDTFYAETQEAYRAYQKESLPIQEQIAEEKAAQTRSAIFGVLGAVTSLAGANQNSNTGNVIAAVGAIAAVAAIKTAMDSNENLKEYSNIYDEMGQNLDLKVSPQVRKFEDSEVELSGTASQQYAQWQAHLQELYKANKTPETRI